jgi:aminopeptidase N
MRSTVRSSVDGWDERVYGREYDLDVFNIVAVAISTSARWRTRASTSSTRATSSPIPTPRPTPISTGSRAVVAHEYFHNWTGNRVTCRDWFQLSLKEGLTVFRDQELLRRHGHSRAVKRIEDVRKLRAAQFPEDAGPLAHPIRPDHPIWKSELLYRDGL